MPQDLRPLFEPESVAVVGASANPQKLGHVILSNVVRDGRRVFPVNPKDESILGLKCYSSVTRIPGRVDLAVISLPAELCVEAVRECVDKDVGVVAVTSSGFRESGEGGRRVEESLLGAISSSRTRLLGPNTMGVLVPGAVDTLSIAMDRLARPRRGNVAVVSQSGAVSVSFIEKAEAAGIGVRAVVGLGNKADIDENDLIEYLGDDPGTGCIAMYLESFADGREFVRIAEEVSSVKPLIVVKSGRTPSGAKAASSHTGAIAASSDRLVDGILRQAGAARAYDEEEMIDLVKALSHVGSLRGDRICVVASAGGFGVMASDYVTSAEHGAGMRMATLSESTKGALREVVPSFSSVDNPIDLTLSVTDEMYDSVLGVLKRDEGVDGILMSLELQPPNVTKRLVDITIRHATNQGAPLVVSMFGGDETSRTLRTLEESGVPAYPTLWRGVRALKALAERGAHLQRKVKKSQEKTHVARCE